MPRKRTRRSTIKEVNYRISDSDDDDDYASRKIEKPLVHEGEERNKRIKYYISSDSEDDSAETNPVDVETENAKNLESDTNDLITEVRELAAKSAALCEELMQRSRYYNETTINNEEVEQNSENPDVGVIDLTNVLETKPVNKPPENSNSEAQSVVDLCDSLSEPVNEPEPSKDSTPFQNPKPILECPVCMEELRNCQPKVTPCGHYFCQSCIKKFGSKSFNCPTCRKKCYVKRLYSIYL